MKQVVSNMKKSPRAKWLALIGGSLLLVALLAAAGSAATPGVGTTSLSVSMQQAVTPVLSGAFTPGRVIIPAKPTPRSPFQPPRWVPPRPPWVKP